jgi:hypothetical protein
MRVDLTRLAPASRLQAQRQHQATPSDREHVYAQRASPSHLRLSCLLIATVHPPALFLVQAWVLARSRDRCSPLERRLVLRHYRRRRRFRCLRAKMVVLRLADSWGIESARGCRWVVRAGKRFRLVLAWRMLWSLRAGHEGCAWLRGHRVGGRAVDRWRVRVYGEVMILIFATRHTGGSRWLVS